MVASSQGTRSNVRSYGVNQGLRLQVDGIPGPFEAISRNAVGADLNPLLRTAWQTAVTRQFQSLGAYGGAAWRPLSPPYSRWKAIHYPAKPILEATGALKNAALHPRIRLRVAGVTATIPSLYGAYHQFGTRNMPARPPIPESAIERAWSLVWRDYILRVIRNGYGPNRRRPLR